MRENVDNIDIYNDSAIILNNKTPKRIISWITILFILLILFILFSFVRFNTYKTYIGYIELEASDIYFISKLDYDDFPIIKSKKLYIKGKSYSYNIVKIDDGNLILKINLDDSLNIEGNIMQINILSDRTSIFNMIKNKIRKGFGL